MFSFCFAFCFFIFYVLLSHQAIQDVLIIFSYFFVSQAFDSLIKTGRLDLRNTDVKPYIVDGITYLCELSHGIRRNFYYGPTYGEDVPDWQVRGLNPRSVKLDDDMTSLFD